MVVTKSRYAAELNQVRDKLVKYTKRTISYYSPSPSSLEPLFYPDEHTILVCYHPPPPSGEDEAGRLDIIELTKIGTLRTPSHQPRPPRIPWLYHDSPGASTSSGRGYSGSEPADPGIDCPRDRESTPPVPEPGHKERIQGGQLAGRPAAFGKKNGPITSHGRGTWRVATWRRRRAVAQKPTTSNTTATAFVYQQLIARLHCCVLLTLFGPIRLRNSTFSVANMINIYSKRLNRVAQDTWLFSNKKII